MEMNTHTYKFEIQWNTGDEYWDNVPDDDEYEGTIEGLNEYLNSQLSEEDPPANFDEEALRALIDGKTVYDETGARYSVKLEDGVNESVKQMQLSEALERLNKAGLICEVSDKAASIREQITRVALNKFDNIPYDEYEQEPYSDTAAIDTIPDEKFFEVMKFAINAKTQEEVLQAAEDESKFNTLADAWLEYLLDCKECLGWDYTWD